MFAAACIEIRNCIYGIAGISQVDTTTVNCSTGTSFMVAPGILVTASHVVHIENDIGKPIHTNIDVIRSPDIGQTMERAHFIAEDSHRDIALLRLENPRSTSSIRLHSDQIPTGTSCGSLGFPLAPMEFLKQGRIFHLVERFQGANISSFHEEQYPKNRTLPFYETDCLMYGGSSGCPGFLDDGMCFGMHNKSIVDRPPGSGGTGPLQRETRIAISLWVPSFDIIAFLHANQIDLPVV